MENPKINLSSSYYFCGPQCIFKVAIILAGLSNNYTLRLGQHVFHNMFCQCSTSKEDGKKLKQFFEACAILGYFRYHSDHGNYNKKNKNKVEKV